MTDLATVGDNLPSEPVDPLRERLLETHSPLVSRRDELLAGIDRAPETVNDDEAAGKMGDFSQKQIAGCLKALEGARVAEKEPFLSAGRTVDGFFHDIMTPLKAGKATIDARRKDYLDRKAAIERQARLEAERKARAEAAAAAKAADEAAAALRKEEGLAAAIAAEEEAKIAAANAEQAAKAAAAKPAELSRVRGEFGSVSSLKQFWDFAGLNRDTLDLDALREHLPLDALEKAVRSFIKAGGRELRGVRIYENTRL